VGNLDKGSSDVHLLQHTRKAAGLSPKWVQPNYWSTQILTEHDNFHAKFLQLGLIQNSLCKCGAEEDTVWHFILECLSGENP